MLLLGLCLVAPAKAGLFADDDARVKIQKLEVRMLASENGSKNHINAILELQSQIEVLKAELRNLRGQSEEVAHTLKDTEKRQKDFYVDLDTRIRRIESAQEAAKEAALKEAIPIVVPAIATDPAPENRAFEAAYSLHKGGDHATATKALQEFLKQYPESVHVPNANYWLASSQFTQKEYQNALTTYLLYLKDNPKSSKAPDALYGVAASQRGLKRTEASHKTLKQLIAKYPDSPAAEKAKKLLDKSR